MASRLFENYELVKQKPIATGGFADIYQAKHTILGTLACLKTNNLKNKDPEAIELLRHEASLLWTLDGFHSIPTIRDYFEPEKNTGVVVMSYIEGKSLHDYVEAKGPLHAEDACWITERLLAALHYVHYRGIIHSDIKPQNVLVEPVKHDIKLIDFGLAVDKPTRLSKPRGLTEAYAAPELREPDRAKRKPPIPETDIYGAGMCLLYVLGGDVLSRTLPKGVPKTLEAYCNQLLVHDPTKRPHWDKNDPAARLSDIREELFGRRHSR